MHSLSSSSNPFSTRFTRPGAVPYLFAAGDSVELLVERLATNDWRGQIIGPHGCGKSTLLASLLSELQRVGRHPLLVALHDGQRRLPIALSGIEPTIDLIVVDGYEQLSRFSRWRLGRRCRRRNTGLLVTAHADVGLPTLFAARPKLETMLAVVEHLLPREQWPFSEQDVVRTFTGEHENARETLFALYDLYQHRIVQTPA